jgi:hypothetical protein
MLNQNDSLACLGVQAANEQGEQGYVKQEKEENKKDKVESGISEFRKSFKDVMIIVLSVLIVEGSK